MDAYKLLISPDIATHCEKIGYVFDPLDIAVLAELSDRPMKERHDIWRELISAYPDMPLVESANFMARDSLHELLAELIATEEKEVEAFYAASDRHIYRPDDKITDDCYSTAVNAVAAVHACLEDDEDSKMPVFSIHRRRLDPSSEKIGDGYAGHAMFTADGEIIRAVLPDTEWVNRLDRKFIHIPMPFRAGDIVMGRDGQPRVLTYLPHWEAKYMEDEKVKYSGNNSRWFKASDGSDMLGEYYWFEDGSLICDHGPPYFYELMYYRGALTGENRFLSYLSHCMKRHGRQAEAWSECAVEMISFYQKIMAEKEAQKKNWRYDSVFERFAKGEISVAKPLSGEQYEP